MSIEQARHVADAVLYEGYLLYPYRATSSKNLVRWQFGVLGPQGAQQAGSGEDSHLRLQCLLSVPDDLALAAAMELIVYVRFLQVQQRQTERLEDDGSYTEVTELRVDGPDGIDGRHWYAWDEAVEVECPHPLTIGEALAGDTWDVIAESGEDIELVHDHQGRAVGRLIRRRSELRASVSARLEPIGGAHRLTLTIDNQAAADGLAAPDVLQRSLLSTHVIMVSESPELSFVSTVDPPTEAVEAAAACEQYRCWPVLAGEPGDDSMILGSPIILYDHPEIADQSAGALFDSTEIDEILTLRVMTMTDQEKAEARATDARAAEIIDRCDRLGVEELQQLHGILVDQSLDVPTEFADAVAEVAADSERPWFDTGDVPWWDPAVDERVQPDVDAVLINGVSVAKDSLVRVHPSRRADAQDLFFADQIARVTQVLADVDGGVHVAVVLIDDPAADLHDWYGRYLYFAPDELEPLPGDARTPQASLQREEN